MNNKVEQHERYLYWAIIILMCWIFIIKTDMLKASCNLH